MAATTNSYLVGNQTQFPSFKPKTISQSLLHLTKPNTISLTSRTKSVSIRCASSTTHGAISTTTVESETTVYSFATGVAGFPTAIPHNVFLEARSELYNWKGTGKSVKEMRYPDCEFYRMRQMAEYYLRMLLKIPSDYSVLFLPDGAPNQLAALPLNLCKSDDSVDYLVTGSWGDKAFKEAQIFCNPNLIWSGKSEKYTQVPSFDNLEQNLNAKYLHICANETIHGVEFKNYPVPKNPNGILIADMSSNFCSKPVDVSKFGVIYAGPQKNVGPGLATIVIIRKDLLGNARDITPEMLNYKVYDRERSVFDTPSHWLYLCGLVLDDLLNQGGLKEVEKKNQRKAELVYSAIDESKGFFNCPVEKSVRSLMNIRFTLEKSELEAEFIKEAAKEDLVNLKGHRSLGGMKASLSNATPLTGVEKLVAFMKDFQAKHT